MPFKFSNIHIIFSNIHVTFSSIASNSNILTDI